MRRHSLAAGTGFALVLCLAALMALLQWRAALRRDVRQAREALAATQRLAEKYAALRRRIESAAMRLPPEKSLTIETLKTLAGPELAPRLRDLRAESSRTPDGPPKVTLHFRLEGVTRRELAEFLAKVEDEDPAISAEWIDMAPNKARAEYVDATLKVSAYAAEPPTTG